MRKLLSVVELGGYPNFSSLYSSHGFDVTVVTSMRKAISTIKKSVPDVIVAEFNYQSDFRDRTSSLESLLAAAERYGLHGEVKSVVFYEKENRSKLDRLLVQFSVFETMIYPVDESALSRVMEKLSLE